VPGRCSVGVEIALQALPGLAGLLLHSFIVNVMGADVATQRRASARRGSLAFLASLFVGSGASSVLPRVGRQRTQRFPVYWRPGMRVAVCPLVSGSTEGGSRTHLFEVRTLDFSEAWYCRPVAMIPKRWTTDYLAAVGSPLRAGRCFLPDQRKKPHQP